MFKSRINRWWTVFAGAWGSAVGAGIFVVYVLSVLTKPLAAELGVARSVISFADTCFLVTSGLGSVSLGVLINRYGVRRPTFVYVAVSALCVAAIPWLPSRPLALYALFAVFGVAGAAATTFPYAVAIAGVFDRHRGLALGLAVGGGGLGGAVAPQLANALLQAVGWRETLWAFAALMATPLIALLLIVRTPEGVIEPPRQVGEPPAAKWAPFLPIKATWLIGLTITGISIGVFGVLAVLVPLLTDRGMTPAKAAAVLSTAGLTSWIGRILVGALLDRFWAPLIASLVCLGASVGVLLVAGGASVPLMALGAALTGLALGAEGDLLTYLCSRYFRLQSFSRIVGAMWVLWAWGGGVGTSAAGLAYALTGAYDRAMLFLAAGFFVAAVAVLFLGPYSFPPPSHAEGRRCGPEPAEGCQA